MRKLNVMLTPLIRNCIVFGQQRPQPVNNPQGMS